jgi:hypothetical protein
MREQHTPAAAQNGSDSPVVALLAQHLVEPVQVHLKPTPTKRELLALRALLAEVRELHNAAHKSLIKPGDRLGRFVVIEMVGKNRYGGTMVRAQCDDCGKERTLRASDLRRRTYRCCAKRPRVTHCVHGHEYVEANIYLMKDGSGRRVCRTCKRRPRKEQASNSRRRRRLAA